GERGHPCRASAAGLDPSSARAASRNLPARRLRLRARAARPDDRDPAPARDRRGRATRRRRRRTYGRSTAGGRRPPALPAPRRRAAARRRRSHAPPPHDAPGATARVGVTALSLPERILAIDRALVAVPHAFGGALALAYYAEPRATVDIDLNVFL